MPAHKQGIHFNSQIQLRTYICK